MKIEELLADKKKTYGSFQEQVKAIKTVVNTLKGLRGNDGKITEEDVMMFFIALKLCRMQTAVGEEFKDSVLDLQGYTKLIGEYYETEK